MNKLKNILLLSFSLLALSLSAQTEIANPQGVVLSYTFNDSLRYATVVAQADPQYSGSIVIPESVNYNDISYEVKTIDEKAFMGCTALYEITIPKTIAYIGGHAFKGCSSLKVVNFNAYNCISSSTKMKGKIYSAFEDCMSIVDFRIGNDVTTLPSYLCWGCTGITELTIPENVKYINGAAFIDCTGITRLNFNAVNCISMYSNDAGRRMPAIINSPISQVNFGPFVKVIPDYACFGFKHLTSVTIPESVTMLGGAAFRECNNLTSVIYNASECEVAHSIDGDNIIPSFNNHSIAHVTFGPDVVNIPDYLFWGCKGLTEIRLPDNVQTIGKSAFWGCQGISTVVIPESVEQIGGHAFGNCSNLNTVYFNAVNCVNVVHFENEKPISAFENRAITKVVLGNDVRRIPDYAFAECTNLTGVVIPESVEYIGSKSFFNCRSIQSIVIPEHVQSIGGMAFTGCESLSKVIFNARECSGVSKIEMGLSLSAFQSCNSIKQVSFGDEVRIIPDHLFSDCSNIETITIPRSVETIGSNSFKNCTNLKTLNFNAERCLKLTSDSSMVSAFADNTLAQINFGEDVHFIPDYAFAGCTRLSVVNLPENLERIGKFAFDGCGNIKKIIIPEDVQYIGGGAFRGCLNLRTVNFNAVACLTMGHETDSVYMSAFSGAEIENLIFGVDVEEVPDYAFYGNASIQKIVFDRNLTLIGKHAFAGIESLSEITLPEQLEILGGGAFADCVSLTTVNYNALNLTSAISIVADTVVYPFEGENKIKNINLGKKVVNIPEGVFYNSRYVADIQIPKTMQSIGGMAFANCPELKTVYFDAINCESVGSEVNGVMRSPFEECDELSSAVFSSKIIAVPDYVFYNCKSLVRLTLPSKATRIGDFAFDGCSSLARLSMPKTVTAIGEAAFRGTALKNVSLSEIVSEIGDDAFANCKALKMIRIKKKNPYYTVEKSTNIVAK